MDRTPTEWQFMAVLAERGLNLSDLSRATGWNRNRIRRRARNPGSWSASELRDLSAVLGKERTERMVRQALKRHDEEQRSQ